ncbi:MAG: serine hydrolase [Planctomycetes bacterium]|jgi:CubicO group peptidase (beta-lactamase class C family)|nr:serine hydrolase [Planctomycetota bacterium]
MPTLHALSPLPLLLTAVLAQAPTPLTEAQVVAIATAAHEQFAATGLSIAVIQDGEVLAEVARGERMTGAAMTPTSLFNIASCSKAFTAAAVALLVQDGKLQWDDPVVTHVPEFRLADPWITAHMTIRDLLCHRCGLVTFAGDLLWYGSDRDDAEVMARMAKLPITQRFREQYGYQNLMYLVAGQVVQRCSGSSWEEFVEQRLFTPLGMTTSRAAAQRLPAGAEKALPHIDGEAIPDHEFAACKPAASIYSSVHELTAWMRMLLAGGEWQGNRILTEASLRELWRPQVLLAAGAGAGTADFRSYGLGWFLSLERGHKLVEHDGGMPGFLSKVSLLPAERFGFVVLNNANDGVLNEACKRALLLQRAGGDGLAELQRIAELVPRLKERERKAIADREAARRPDTEPSLDAAAYTGQYEDAVHGAAEITLVDDRLHVALLPSKRRLSGSLQHWHHDTFRVDWPDRFLPFGLVRFELDHQGAVAGFRIDCPIADFDFAALDFRRRSAR